MKLFSGRCTSCNPPKILYRYYSIVVARRCSRLATLPKAEDTLFEVSGYEVKQTATGQQTTENFTYMTKNVVLATGEPQAASAFEGEEGRREKQR
jgi:hypothetical protein